MRIDRIDVYRVAMPLVTPFRTAFADDTAIESVLVRMEGDGLFGWGEGAPNLPTYSPESAAGAFVTIRQYLAPRLVGRDIASGEELQALLAPIKGNRFAKAALDLAWWDLEARRRGMPLWRLLGGKGPDVMVGADFGVQDTIDELLALVAGAVADGFARIKLKFRPGWDVDMVAAVRGAFPDATIHVDCNSGFTLADTPMFEKLDAFNLAMIEQPLAHDDLVDHAELARRIATPICLDESVTSVDKARKAIDLGIVGYINIKNGRVGGLTNAVAIHDYCRAAGIPCWVGGMLESAVGSRHNLALATLDNFLYPADVFVSKRFYDPDLAGREVVHSAPSTLTAPETPGCGSEPIAERLEAMTVEHVEIRP
ncbi:MAG: o-succinylbenzoate synthase [Planctomycetes bacterium]|nr:o-succinylbenzoate synthase [Planctomycetota bacterium]